MWPKIRVWNKFCKNQSTTLVPKFLHSISRSRKVARTSLAKYLKRFKIEHKAAVSLCTKMNPAFTKAEILSSTTD